MELSQVLVTSTLWALGLWALYLCRKQSPLHSLVVAVFTTAILGTFFPVATLFVEPSSWRNLSRLSRELLVATQGEFAAWMAGLLAACFLASQLRWLDPGRVERVDAAARGSRRRDFTVAWGLMLGGAVLYAMYVQRVGLAAMTSRVDYAEKYLLSAGLGPFLFGLQMMIAACLWAEAANLSARQKLVFRVIGALIVVWAIAFISVRTYALMLALGYGWIACRRRGIELRRVRISVIAGLVLAYVALEMTSMFRTLYREDFRQAFADLSAQGQQSFATVVGGSELMHPFVTAAEVLHDQLPGELGGQSLPDSVAALMPIAINPDRPLTLSEKFVRSNYTDLAGRGGGTAFSIVAEAWLDFGSLVGPFVLGTAFGALLLWAERRAQVRCYGLLARVAPYFLFFAAMHHRNEVATLLKQVVMLAMAVLPLWIAADAVRLSLSRRPRQLAAEHA